MDVIQQFKRDPSRCHLHAGEVQLQLLGLGLSKILLVLKAGHLFVCSSVVDAHGSAVGNEGVQQNGHLHSQEQVIFPLCLLPRKLLQRTCKTRAE